MIHELFTIKDVKTEIFTRPHNFISRGQLSRELAQIQGDKNNTMALYPEDYVVYFLGTYNDDDASFELVDKPEVVYSLAELFQQMNRAQNAISNETPVQSSTSD